MSSPKRIIHSNYINVRTTSYVKIQIVDVQTYVVVVSLNMLPNLFMIGDILLAYTLSIVEFTTLGEDYHEYEKMYTYKGKHFWSSYCENVFLGIHCGSVQIDTRHSANDDTIHNVYVNINLESKISSDEMFNRGLNNYIMDLDFDIPDLIAIQEYIALPRNRDHSYQILMMWKLNFANREASHAHENKIRTRFLFISGLFFWHKNEIYTITILSDPFPNHLAKLIKLYWF